MLVPEPAGQVQARHGGAQEGRGEDQRDCGGARSLPPPRAPASYDPAPGVSPSLHGLTARPGDLGAWPPPAPPRPQPPPPPPPHPPQPRPSSPANLDGLALPLSYWFPLWLQSSNQSRGLRLNRSDKNLNMSYGLLGSKNI